MSEWNLSDKREPYLEHYYPPLYNEEDVQEFIRRLKEVIPTGRIWAHNVISTIDKLAGEKLI